MEALYRSCYWSTAQLARQLLNRINTPAHESSLSAAAHWSELGDAAIFTASKQCDPQERRRFRCKCRKEIISEEILGRSQGGWNQPDGSNQKIEREGTQNQVMLSNPIAHLLFLQEASNAWNHNNAMERSRGFEPLWACTNHEGLQSMKKKTQGRRKIQALLRIRHERELHAPGGSCGKNNFLKRDQQKTRRKEKINKKIKSKNGGSRVDWQVGESNARSNEHESGKCERGEREMARSANGNTQCTAENNKQQSEVSEEEEKNKTPRESKVGHNTLLNLTRVSFWP